MLPLANGIPSRDTIRRVLVALEPAAFQRCFQDWIASVPQRDGSGLTLVNIDGKTPRGSRAAANGLGAMHIVSARASEHGLALGQVACDEKSNEITAIPVLLEQISLPGTLVTIDARGCQRAIAEQIVDGGGRFVLAVKDNQSGLHGEIRDCFQTHFENVLEDLSYRSHETREQGHGRVDERSYYLARVPKDFAASKDWPRVKAIEYAAR